MLTLRSVAGVRAGAPVSRLRRLQLTERRRQPRSKSRLSIATGGTGGVFYPYGGGIAKVITEHLDNVEATAEVTAASVDNLKFLKQGTSDLAFTMADMAQDAVDGPRRVLRLRRGAGPHSRGPVLELLAPGGARRMRESPRSRTFVDAWYRRAPQVRARPSSHIGSCRQPGSTPAKDIREQSLGVAQSVDALKDGKIDAFFWNGGLPTASILDLVNTPGVKAHFVPTDTQLPRLEQTLRPLALLSRDHPEGDVQQRGRHPGRGCREPARRVRGDVRGTRTRHHAAAIRSAERACGHPSAGPHALAEDRAHRLPGTLPSRRHPLLPRTKRVDGSSNR